MKARVKATGEIWEFSQIDEITFKSAINGNVYFTEELEFLEPSAFTTDYWTRLEHQYAGMAMQGLCANTKFMQDHEEDFQCNEDMIAVYAKDIAHALVERYKKEEK